MSARVGADDYIVTTNASAADLDALPRLDMFPTLAPEALYGLPGRIVIAIDPYTEAAAVATLVHLLVGAGNLIGASPHARVLEDRHPVRLNAVAVGQTSKGRKGVAWSPVRALLRRVDPEWETHCLGSGLSSGEGLIYHVRDVREEQQPIKKSGRVEGYQRVIVDEGVVDKRLLVIEPEFSSVLRRMNGKTNSLSAVIRDAWDSGDLRTLTKNEPMRATGAHISILGHVTREELRRELTETERANGFANRFLFLLVRRSKILPEGAPLPEGVLDNLACELREAVSFAKTVDLVERDAESRAIWATVYGPLSEGKPGMLGAIISRAEAQVLRLSCLYALLDRSALIRPGHLAAALAVWTYAEKSAALIFGEQRGDLVADTILTALQACDLDRTEISGLFHRNVSSARIDAALRDLKSARLAARRLERTEGRTREIWAALRKKRN